MICYVPMRNASASVAVFGAFTIALGFTLLAVPNFLLGIFGIPRTDEVWIRVLGGLAVAVGYYYIESGRANATWFMRASILGRVWFGGVLFALVLLGMAPPVVALFGTVDLAAAAWTAYALGWPQLRRP